MSKTDAKTSTQEASVRVEMLLAVETGAASMPSVVVIATGPQAEAEAAHSEVCTCMSD